MDISGYELYFKSKTKKMKKFNQEFLVKNGGELVDKAKKRSPTDTGALKASWKLDTSKLDKLTISITNPQKYASYVEYGTKKYKQKPEGFRMISQPMNKFKNIVNKKYAKALVEFWNDNNK